jgi:hypothetical protein
MLLPISRECDEGANDMRMNFLIHIVRLCVRLKNPKKMKVECKYKKEMKVYQGIKCKA